MVSMLLRQSAASYGGPWRDSSIREAAVHVVAPLLLADEAIGAFRRGGCLHAHHPGGLLVAGNLQKQLAAGGGLELVALLDGDHERAGAADHAIGVVEVELGKVEEALRQLEHDRQAVDDDALGDQLVAYRHHGVAGIVGTVTRHVDDAADALGAAALEQAAGIL